MPLISVVMPVYNGKRYLKEALESVLGQTFTDFELICVDDGSTDNSFNVLLEYRDRITIIQQANAGQGAARNAGVRAASGRYIAFIDQDDRWYPAKLEHQVAALHADPEAVLVYSNSDRMNENSCLTEVGATLSERPSALVSPLGRLIEEGLVLPSSMLVRRDAFEQVGGFDPDLRGFEDFDLSARLKQVGRFIFLEEPALCYRVHQQGCSSRGGITIIRSRERFLLRMQALYAGSDEKQRLINSMLADCYSDWGMEELRSGNRRQSRALFIRSMMYEPMRSRTYLRCLRTFLPKVIAA
jgi:glycosyltransferase involved in cell wall biosynthesis